MQDVEKKNSPPKKARNDRGCPEFALVALRDRLRCRKLNPVAARHATRVAGRTPSEARVPLGRAYGGGGASLSPLSLPLAASGRGVRPHFAKPPEKLSGRAVLREPVITKRPTLSTEPARIGERPDRRAEKSTPSPVAVPFVCLQTQPHVTHCSAVLPGCAQSIGRSDSDNGTSRNIW